MKQKFHPNETTAFIPVYNEEAFLLPALESIVEQVDRIIIGDNASTDGTEAICRDFQRKYPMVEYYRHATNIGYAANFSFCAEKIETEFAWHFGGHDLLPEGSVPALKHALQARPDAVGTFSDVYDLELDGTEGRKDYYGQLLDATGRTKLVDQLQVLSPLRRGAGFFLGAGQGPPFYLIYALFRSERAVPHLVQFQSICACDWLLVFEMLLEGKMVHVPQTHYIRRNNHPTDTAEAYMKRIVSQGSQYGVLDQARFHPMIESVLGQLIDWPDETLSDRDRWRLYWELERYFRRNYRFTKKVAEAVHSPPPLEYLRHKVITLVRDLRDILYRCRKRIQKFSYRSQGRW